MGGDVHDLGHVVDFFMARKRRSGGFAQGPRLPATIEDTYYALRTLSLMKDKGLHVPVEACWAHEGFLESKLSERDLGARSAFQLAWCINELNLPYEVPTVRLPRGSIHLETLFYLRRLGIVSAEGGAHAEGQGIMTMRDLRMYLFVNAPRTSLREKRHWAAWIKRCQNPDGGLGFMPGTTSFVENCYYGVEALGAIGVIALDARSLLGFVRSCKSGRGGFGRRNLGVPFPSSTWHAVATLLAFS